VEATTDLKLSTKDLRQRSDQASERERSLKKADCEAGGFNIPLLLAMKANTQLEVSIGQRTSFLYKWRGRVVCCTSQCSEVTTIVDTSVGSVVTTTEEGLRESGVCESLSGCWARVVFLPWEVMVPGHVCCTKVPRRRRQRGVSAMMREVERGCEHAVRAGYMQWIITE
jgi:hypothetical protein